MDFTFELAEYACPLVNPPAQRHLFLNKLHNLELAIGRMQDLVLEPGQEFSFWDRALAPTIENGYREGAMFINHRVTSSIGGGLCQLSGLLYNLALLSGCRIDERHNHTIDAYGEERYIPLGRDATVAYGKKNLRFSNPHRYPIRLSLKVTEREASGTVLSTMPATDIFFIRTELLATLPSQRRWRHDPGIEDNQERVEPGLTGKRVLAWRIKRDQAGREEMELLSRDHYRATPTLLYRRRSWPLAALCELGRLARI
jgi:vancomycin resistance protein VanW